MRYLVSLLLLIALPGCMMLGMAGMHGKAAETKIEKPNTKLAQPVSGQSTHEH